MYFLSIYQITWFVFSVCWWPGPFLAAIIWHPSASLLLFPLLLREWSCPYRSHVHSLLVGCQRIGHSSSLCSNGSLIPLQHHGWPDSLRYWLSSCLLWRWLRPTVKMVGLRIHHLRCQYHHLAWCWGFLVEDHRLVVKCRMTSSSFV